MCRQTCSVYGEDLFVDEQCAEEARELIQAIVAQTETEEGQENVTDERPDAPQKDEAAGESQSGGHFTRGMAARILVGLVALYLLFTVIVNILW